jgi:hypothetical protein
MAELPRKSELGVEKAVIDGLYLGEKLVTVHLRLAAPEPSHAMNHETPPVNYEIYR